MNRSMIEGILPPISTPFVDGRVDLSTVSDNLEKLLDTGIHGFVVLGSNGEAALLEEDEQLALVDIVRGMVPQDRWLIVGVSRQSAKQALGFIKKLAEKKIDGTLVLPPNYYRPRMNRSALIGFYRNLADKSPLPILIYNMPRYTGINLVPEVVSELASHDNIIGVKDSSGNIVQIAEIIRDKPPDFSVLAGSGSFLLSTLVLGGQGGIPAVANVAPVECLEILNLYRCGDISNAKKIQLKILRLNRAVTSQYGVAGLKVALDLRGMYGGLPRPPLLPPGKEILDDMHEILEELDLLRAL